MTKTIHKGMTIEEILSSFPMRAQKLSQEITNAGLHCVGCSAATWETLEAGMMGHGKEEEEIDYLVGRLNELLKEQEAEYDPETITLTKRAAEKFKQVLKEDGKEGFALRFGDRLAGCSGFEYILDYSDKASDEDMVFSSNGIEIHVDKASVGRLVGSVIDYVDGLQGAGFKISNPNAKSSCGCGTSHGY
jgi:iron-sulfur cluster assembly accessory protein